jgi:hypothetical protein
MIPSKFDLSYYIGKICTIITGPINRDFQAEAMAMKEPQRYPMNVIDHFMGEVISVDNKLGLVALKHPTFQTIATYRLGGIIGIVEEQVCDGAPPEEYVKTKEFKKNKVICPNGHELTLPDAIEAGVYQCPVCSVPVDVGAPPPPLEENTSEFVDLDSVTKLANEAKHHQADQ